MDLHFWDVVFCKEWLFEYVVFGDLWNICEVHLHGIGDGIDSEGDNFVLLEWVYDRWVGGKRREDGYNGIQ